MAVQRKIFRIEQGGRADAPGEVSARDAEAALRHHEFMAEIKALRSLIEPRAESNREAMEKSRAQIAEAQAYKAELEPIHAAIKQSRARSSRSPERGALPTGPCPREPGTRRHRARHRAGDPATAAGRRGHRTDRQHAVGRAQERAREGSRQRHPDQVVQIFEACNFQDLTGQRVGKVVDTLQFARGARRAA